MQTTNTNDVRIIDIDEVMKRTGLGRSTVYAYIKESRFPASVKVGDRSAGWVESEVAEWLRDRIKASRETV